MTKPRRRPPGSVRAGRVRERPAEPEAAQILTTPSWVDTAAWVIAGTVGLELIAIAAGPHHIGDYYTETDFYGGYAEGARLIQHGRIDPARYGVIGPMYEIALALVGFITRNLFAAAELMSIGSAVGALLLWYALLRCRAGAVPGLVTVAFLATNPTFFRYGYSVTTDMLAFFLEAAALFAILALRGRWAPLAAGSLSALAVLTRYSAIALLPGAMACYAWLAPVDVPSRRQALTLYLAGFACVSFPWFAFALHSGHPPGAMLFHDIAYDIYARAGGQTWAEYQTRLQPGFHTFVDVLLRDPAAVLRREGANLVTHFSGDARNLLGWPVSLTCASGLLLVAVDRAPRKLVPLWLLGGLLYLALIPAVYSERYSLVLAPFYLTLAGAAAGSPWLARIVRVKSAPVLPALVCIPLALSLIGSVSAQRATLDALPTEVLPAARALRAHAQLGARVMAAKPQIAYSSGLDFVSMPASSQLAELAAVCKRQRVQYLYYSWIEANNHPSFWYLLDPRADVPGLGLITCVTGHPAVLYRIGPDFGRPPAWLANDSARVGSEDRVIAAMPPAWAWRVHLSLAVAALEQQRFRDAFAHASVVIRDRPAEPLGWRLYGDASLRLHDPTRAIAAFEHGLALEPDDVNMHVVLGWVLLGTGRADRAAAVWRPIVSATSERRTLDRMIELFHSLGDAAAEQRARDALGRQTR